MLFNSLQYIIFLPVVVAVYWLAPRRLRPLLLLVASYYFYMSWLKAYGLLLLGLTLWNYFMGLFVAGERPTKRRLFFIAAITGNLACLALFKYTNFLIQSIWSLAQSFLSFGHLAVESSPKADVMAPLLPIILPLGISFFVFEFIHYLVDVRRGTEPVRDPIRFGLFAAFFPSQIAGPIKRFQDFDPQINESKFDGGLFKAGLWLVIEGMFKKVVLGDNLAQLVQPGFDAPLQMGTLDAWICVLAFTLQIYYDFSGYTDVGRGSAMLLGYRLPENFDMPYIARNLSDFWRRWHISLSTWLRDYLYIPMGGSKVGKFKQARNLCITMLLGGLWHGAAWHYVIWGAFHGAGLVVTHTWQNWSAKIPRLNSAKESFAWDISGRLFTLFLVMMAWVVFRADDMTQAAGVYGALFGFRPTPHSVIGITTLLLQSVVPVALVTYAVLYWLKRFLKPLQSKKVVDWRDARWWLSPPVAAEVIAMAGIGIITIGLSPFKAIPFIYFQF